MGLSLDQLPDELCEEEWLPVCQLLSLTWIWIFVL